MHIPRVFLYPWDCIPWDIALYGVGPPGIAFPWVIAPPLDFAPWDFVHVDIVLWVFLLGGFVLEPSLIRLWTTHCDSLEPWQPWQTFWHYQNSTRHRRRSWTENTGDHPATVARRIMAKCVLAFSDLSNLNTMCGLLWGRIYVPDWPPQGRVTTRIAL